MILIEGIRLELLEPMEWERYIHYFLRNSILFHLQCILHIFLFTIDILQSTFIKVLTGQQAIDQGEINTGETVVFGVYDQMGLEIENANERVLEFVKERVEAGNDGMSMAEAPQEAMKLLKRFEFQRDRWNER